MSRILIIEDEARIAAFLEKGLRQHGFNTTIAVDGEQALQIIQDNEFDLLLLDLGLPLKDGWTVLGELRDRGRRIPVIIVTARDEIDINKDSLGMEVKDIIHKPFRFQELLGRVQNHID